MQLHDLKEERLVSVLEEPKFDTMNLVSDAGWVDCAWIAPRPCICGSVKATCPYKTRIDYILCNYVTGVSITSYRVFDMSETDHNGVFATFCPVYSKWFFTSSNFKSDSYWDI